MDSNIPIDTALYYFYAKYKLLGSENFTQLIYSLIFLIKREDYHNALVLLDSFDKPISPSKNDLLLGFYVYLYKVTKSDKLYKHYSQLTSVRITVPKRSIWQKIYEFISTP